MLLLLTYALLVAAANSIAAHWVFMVFGGVFSPEVALLGPILLVRFELRTRRGLRALVAAAIVQALITLGIGWWLGSPAIMRSAEIRFQALFFAEVADACVWALTYRWDWRRRVVCAHAVFVALASTTFSIGQLGADQHIIVGRLLAALLIALASTWVVVRHYMPHDKPISVTASPQT